MDREQRYQQMLKEIPNFRLIDDTFMNVCFENSPECTQLVLRIILGKDDLVVKSVSTQRRMKNLVGRDVCLDICAEDSENRTINIEIQRANEGATERRARYHSSILDAHLLMPGSDFKDLPETYVIFITENDVLGKGKPLYAINRRIDDTDDLFNDGEHIIFVNGKNRDGATALGRLMQDFFCTDPDAMNYKALADKAKYFKHDEKGVKTMCKAVEALCIDAAEEAAAEAAAEARQENKIETALRMIQKQMSLDLISELSGLPIAEVKALAESKSA